MTKLKCQQLIAIKHNALEEPAPAVQVSHTILLFSKPNEQRFFSLISIEQILIPNPLTHYAAGCSGAQGPSAKVYITKIFH